VAFTCTENWLPDGKLHLALVVHPAEGTLMDMSTESAEARSGQPKVAKNEAARPTANSVKKPPSQAAFRRGRCPPGVGAPNTIGPPNVRVPRPPGAVGRFGPWLCGWFIHAATLHQSLTGSPS
jgi:hypothetical protein